MNNIISEKQRQYIIDNFEKGSIDFIAKHIGVNNKKVYDIARRAGLRRNRPENRTKVYKTDVSINPDNLEIPRVPENLIPYRVDKRTIILIPAGEDPTKRIKRFLQRLQASHNTSRTEK